MRVPIVLALILCAACSPVVNASPDSKSAAPASSPSGLASRTTRPGSTAIPSGTPRRSADTDRPTPTPTAADEFQFIRWSGGYVVLASEPGGPVSASQDVHVDQTAAVLDRVEVDGVEWVRVQFGSDRTGDWVAHAWAPAEADIDRGGGIHDDPVYEYVDPDCPEGQPTLGDLAGMVPLLALHCFGSTMLTFSPVQVREDGAPEAGAVAGTPEWLAEGGDLAAYWLPKRQEAATLHLRIDPASGVEVPLNEWIEISGRLDNPAAKDCVRTSTHEEFALRNQAEAVLLCRGRFVVTGTRPLTNAEIPPVQLAPGPEPTQRVPIAVRENPAPVATRHLSSTVWTGEQLLVWGGWDSSDERGGLKNDGFAYSPATSNWTAIPASPIAARTKALSAWTGTELLVWGGERDEESQLPDGAAYNPATDAWRVLGEGPLAWTEHSTSVWKGTEWWIAVGNRTGATDVAAYDPVTDQWRSLPSIPDGYADTPIVAWTGTESLLLTAAGFFSMSADASEWIPESAPPDAQAPAVWTGDRLVMIASSPIGDEPLDFDYLVHPVAWDPQTRAPVELPPPPHNVFEPVVAGDWLAFFRDGLALNLSSDQWVGLDVSAAAQKALDRVDATRVWMGDRLVVWGGFDACTTEPSRSTSVIELVPDWPAAHSVSASDSTRRFAVRALKTAPGLTGTSSRVVFAC